MDGDQGLRHPLHGRPRLQLSLLLSGPLGWLVIAYLGSLAVLFVAAFWRLDSFTSEVVRDFSLQNFQTLWDSDVYRSIAGRTFASRLSDDHDRSSHRSRLNGEVASETKGCRRGGPEPLGENLVKYTLRTTYRRRGS